MTDKKRTSMWVSPETVEHLEKLEKKYEQSRSFLIARAIKDLFEGDRPTKTRLILTKRKR